eukprot:403376668
MASAGGNRPQNVEEEEATLKKLQKEKSSSIIGHSLTQFNQLCMPRCLNFKDPALYQSERQCLRDCVKSFHRTHNRVFNQLLDFEDKLKKDEIDLANQLNQEIQEEKREQIKQQKIKVIEDEELVKL